IFQLRTGAVPLARYLSKIKMIDSARCPCCKGADRSEETVRHYLLECPRFRPQRRILRGELGQDSNLLSALLNTEKGVRATIRYIASTQQL
ncbi:hypothetical protein BDV98DRAFT_480333, partial [Pterulicium gracile]